MILHAFYNREGIGDILLVRLGNGTTDTTKKENDLVVLEDKDKNVIGFNILNASNKFDNLTTGLVKITKEFVQTLNKYLQEYKIDETLIDYKPKFIVGKVVEIEEHPDSDHMHICQVDLGNEVTQIVCGAPNIALNQTVVVASIGAVMPSGLIIKPSKLRNVPSNGMICSQRELNLPNAPKERGIMVLDESEYKVGDSFFK